MHAFRAQLDISRRLMGRLRVMFAYQVITSAGKEVHAAHLAKKANTPGKKEAVHAQIANEGHFKLIQAVQHA